MGLPGKKEISVHARFEWRDPRDLGARMPDTIVAMFRRMRAVLEPVLGREVTPGGHGAAE
jgi:hypothetical protein